MIVRKNICEIKQYKCKYCHNININNMMTEPITNISSPMLAYNSIDKAQPLKIDILENIKNKIESMDKYHQIEILKILSKTLCKINENKSGVYVNLSFLSQDSVNEIMTYIDYIKEQDCTFNTIEYQKDEFKNAFFVEKEDKDNKTITYISLNK